MSRPESVASAVTGPDKHAVRRWAVPAAVLVIAALSVWLLRGLGPEAGSRSAMGGGPGTVVVMPDVESTDSSLVTILHGFAEVLTDELVRLSRLGAIPVAVAPAADMREYAITSMSEAGRIFGADSIITVQIADLGGSYRLGLGLMPASGSPLIDSTTFVVTSLRYGHGRAVQDAARFLSADGEIVSSVATSVEPSAFKAYLRSLGLLGMQNPSVVKQAVELLEPVATNHADLPQAKEAFVRALAEHLDASGDTASFVGALDALETRAGVGSAGVLTQLGLAYQRLDSTDRAVDFLGQALRDDPLCGDALVALANLFDRTGRFAEADSLYNLVVELDPKYWRSYMRRGVFLYYQGRYDEAVDAFKGVVERSPKYARGYASLGAAYFALRDFEAAERVFLSFPGKDAALYSNAATLYYYQGNYREAVRWYENALGVDDSDPTVWSNLADAYYWLGNEEQNYRTHVQEALRRTELEFAKDPESMILRARLANFYARLADTAKAIDMLRAFGDAPDPTLDGVTVFSVAAAWEELGNRRAALIWVKAALERNYARSAIEHYPGLEELRDDARYKEIESAFGAM